MSSVVLVAPRFAERNLWTIGAGSLRFDVRELDHLAPLLGFVGKELAVVGGRARNRSAALFGKPRLDLRIGEARVDLTIELVDDFGRRVLGGAKSQPSACLISGHKIAHDRN